MEPTGMAAVFAAVDISTAATAITAVAVLLIGLDLIYFARRKGGRLLNRG